MIMILCGWVGIAQFGTFPATFALVPLDNSPEETMEDAKQTTINRVANNIINNFTSSELRCIKRSVMKMRVSRMIAMG